MGVQFRGGCYADAEAAAAAMSASELGAVYSAGGSLWAVSASSATASSVTLELTDVLGTAVVTRTLVPPFQPCSLLDWEDGLDLGWGVVGIWVVVAGVLFMALGTRAAE
jgi:hypothetical protein